MKVFIEPYVTIVLKDSKSSFPWYGVFLMLGIVITDN